MEYGDLAGAGRHDRPAVPRSEPARDATVPAATEPGDLDGAGSSVTPARRALDSAGGRLSGWLHRHGLRVDPGHRGGAAMGVAAVVAGLVACWWVFSSRPHAVAVSGGSAPTVAAASPAPRPSTGPPSLVVDVVGRVGHPGVYHLRDGARVDDALRAAGGALPGVDVSPLNLARKLTDGEQVAVGVAGAGPPPGAPPTAAGSAGSVSALIDLNTASVAQLDTLPGVGPVLAQRIVDWRSAHGRFDSVDQLRDVTGIGESRFADVKALVTV